MPSSTSTYQRQLQRELKRLPKEYVPNLLQIVRLYRESVTLKPARESFSEGWKEALQGKTHPIAELWKDV
ncbi:MAG: hypothetical protein HY961_12155 [Ignavibacteriae bacterium]|nr:hypothetical protein [Ignavibacteriota bacterium]